MLYVCGIGGCPISLLVKHRGVEMGYYGLE